MGFEGDSIVRDVRRTGQVFEKSSKKKKKKQKNDKKEGTSKSE